mgnify:CR=1 FL=1
MLKDNGLKRGAIRNEKKNDLPNDSFEFFNNLVPIIKFRWTAQESLLLNNDGLFSDAR